MSRKWKIATGAVIAAVVVAGVALTVWGAVTFRSRVYEHGWAPRAHKWEPEAATQLRCPESVEGEVRLVDDDGDGVPDRGVIEVPEDLQHGCGYGPSILRRGSRQAMPFGFAQDKLRGGPHFGHGFGPSTMLRTGPHFGRGFGPFLIVGGLFRLAFLALLIGLGVACFRCWGRAKEAREPQRG
jgi:hypothetical protein